MQSVKNAWVDGSIRRLLAICSDFGRGQFTNNLHQYHLIYCIHTNYIPRMMLRRKAQQWPTALQDSCFPAHEKMRGAFQWVLACIKFYLKKRQVLLSLSTIICIYIYIYVHCKYTYVCSMDVKKELKHTCTSESNMCMCINIFIYSNLSIYVNM